MKKINGRAGVYFNEIAGASLMQDEKTAVLQCESASHFIKLLQANPDKLRESVGFGEWQLGAKIDNKDQFIAQLKKPDHEALKKANEIQLKIENLIERPKSARKPIKSEQDGSLNIDRYMDGDSEFWDSYKSAGTGGSRTITLIANIGNTGEITPNMMMVRACCTVATVDVLEELGYRVNLYGVNCAYLNHPNLRADKWCALFPIKHEDDVLDKMTVLNLLSAWFFRVGMVIYARGIFNKSGHGLTPIDTPGSFRADVLSYIGVKEAYRAPHGLDIYSATEQLKKLITSIENNKPDYLD